MSVKQSSRQKAVVSVGIEWRRLNRKTACRVPTPPHGPWPPACHLLGLHGSDAWRRFPVNRIQFKHRKPNRRWHTVHDAPLTGKVQCVAVRKTKVCWCCAADITRPQNHPQKVTLETQQQQQQNPPDQRCSGSSTPQPLGGYRLHTAASLSCQRLYCHTNNTNGTSAKDKFRRPDVMYRIFSAITLFNDLLYKCKFGGSKRSCWVPQFIFSLAESIISLCVCVWFHMALHA